jgi:CheY-like chemotaxis protein
MNGIEFKKEIDSDPHLALQAIPFIFMSCSFAPTEVERAYTQRPQGYFVKPDGIDALQDNLHTILKYWKDAVLPVTN